MYILFSPSEGKNSGGCGKKLSHLLFGLDKRTDILNAYNSIMERGDTELLQQLFGIKKSTDYAPYVQNLFEADCMAAIERYSGVAYDYLDYTSLNERSRGYLQEHTVIFSNLFGPIMGGDFLPNYKVKQGNSIEDIAPDKFYKEHFSRDLDLLLQKHDILDLRAGYYDKFYKIPYPYTTLKFIKEGKVVSHWAKAYRGIVLRRAAQHQIGSIEDLMKLEIDGLMVNEIKKMKMKTEIVFEIK
jgi:cytoplasmic iron level regulating protein YaaA (DUF328/UPF0246 family)